MSKPSRTEVDEEVATLAAGILQGQRRALARGITLVESQRPDHVAKAQSLLEELSAHTGQAMRVGISGVPGVGKSTFIENLGLRLLAAGQKVAVLAVDPTSPKSGGSILGDKTRMERLSQDSNAFIRPSPSGLHLGGVARQTREAMLLCEAAGFDVVLVETVGVGQSEAEVSSMVDTFVLLLLPAGGDELQGVKRGVLELCDVVAVNKADGELLDAAKKTQAEYQRALHLLRPEENGWRVPVRAISAAEDQGLQELWADAKAHAATLKASGALGEKRRNQSESWMWKIIDEEIRRRFRDHQGVKDALAEKRDAVRQGSLSPGRAAHDLMALFLSGD